MAAFNFNANEVEPSTGGGPIPPGTYRFHVIESDLNDASSGRGQVLSLVYEVLEGEYQGRKVYERLNVVHENAVSQKIGQQGLSAICHATGRMQITDTEELLWGEFEAETKIEKYKKQDGGDGETARIKKYLFSDGQTPPETKAAPQPQERTAPQSRGGANKGGANVPWKKSA